MIYININYSPLPLQEFTQKYSSIICKNSCIKYFYNNRVVKERNSLPESVVDSPFVIELKWCWTDI